ncbi:gamma carbonic anhydrase family protein, partial [Chloroflexota bacterium]
MIYSFDGREPSIGSGTYVSETAIVVGDVRIGDDCYIGHGAIIRGDYGSVQIGNGTAVEEGVVIHAPPDESCCIGDKVTLGHGAIIHSQSISSNATVGMGAILSLWSEVGEASIVAEGSVVRRKQIVPSRVVVGGNPAKVIRKTTDKDNGFWEWGKQLYIDLAHKY